MTVPVAQAAAPAPADAALLTPADRWRSFFAPNVWPDDPAELRDAWLEYERAVGHVADALLRAMACALDLDENWFVQRCEHAIVTTRASVDGNDCCCTDWVNRDRNVS